VTTLAMQIARAGAVASGEPVDLGAPVVCVGTYATPMAIDPFAVSLEEKLDLLFRADALMRRNASRLPKQCDRGATVPEMIRSTRLGLYITRFWYTRIVHPRDAVVDRNDARRHFRHP
jgi:predicted Zn-dependent protease